MLKEETYCLTSNPMVKGKEKEKKFWFTLFSIPLLFQKAELYGAEILSIRLSSSF